MLASKARRVSLTGHQLCQGLGAHAVSKNEPVRKAEALCRGFLLGELPQRLRMGPSLYPRGLTCALFLDRVASRDGAKYGTGFLS